jgi:hypothetical protein
MPSGVVASNTDKKQQTLSSIRLKSSITAGSLLKDRTKATTLASTNKSTRDALTNNPQTNYESLDISNTSARQDSYQ